jgi:hypothetical protein
MNVHLLPVILMPFVQTLMVALPVHVILDTVETDLIVLVKYYFICKLLSNPSPSYPIAHLQAKLPGVFVQLALR